ncbi:MAG TPA: hypothetical protein PKD53_14210 [Chloroflexaceae bacterium]|nr:hypothetical protein [Chloroflexaceae bacterium]
MELIYHLSEEARHRIFVETGRDPGREQALAADPAELDADARRLLASVNPSLAERAVLTVPGWSLGMESQRPYTLDDPADDPAALLAGYQAARLAGRAAVRAGLTERLEAQLRTLESWDSEREPGVLNRGYYAPTGRVAELEAAHAAATARAQAKAAELRRQREAEEVARQQERQAREAEKRAWIADFGSDHLRRCMAGGYNCQRQYVLDRAAREFPGYVVDYNDAAAWHDRSGPSEAALIEAERVGGTVVWLTSEPGNAVVDDPDAGYGFEPCEAVVVRGYLGKYDLIKLV